MQEKTTKKQERNIQGSQLAASKRFGKYKGEKAKKIRDPQIVKNPAYKQLLNTWKNFLVLSKAINDVEQLYKFAESMVKHLEFSPKLVEQLSVSIPDTKFSEDLGGRAGFFLSALINTGSENNYVIYTFPSCPINWFAYNNVKNVVVEGDLQYVTARQMKGGKVEVKGNIAHTVGENMTGGELIVHGNVGELLGKMLEGGTIICMGNAKGSAGSAMRKGKLVVHGNVGTSLGSGMTGGEIHVHGEFADDEIDPYNTMRGKIYHKGILIFDK
jgi:hypothetical protein